MLPAATPWCFTSKGKKEQKEKEEKEWKGTTLFWRYHADQNCAGLSSLFSVVSPSVSCFLPTRSSVTSSSFLRSCPFLLSTQVHTRIVVEAAKLYILNASRIPYTYPLCSSSSLPSFLAFSDYTMFSIFFTSALRFCIFWGGGSDSQILSLA